MTSPPYWNLKDYEHPDQIGQESYSQYIERMNKVWQECYRVSNKDAILAINVGNRRVNKQYYPIAMDIYSSMENWCLIDNLIWFIPNALPQPYYYMDCLFDDKYENVLIFAKNYSYKYTFNKPRVKQKYATLDPRKEKLNPSGRGLGNVIKIPAYRPPNIKSMNYHVAAYPEELVYLLMQTFTNEGDTVLDPFLGSGTTLKVAYSINRNGIGYEINENLKDVIENRIKERWQPPDFSYYDIVNSYSEYIKKSKGPRRPKSNKFRQGKL